MKAVIFGAGSLGHQVYHKIKPEFTEITFVDNNFMEIDSVHLVSPATILKEMEFDRLFIAARVGAENIYEQLVSELGIKPCKIDQSFLAGTDYLKAFDIRNRFLKGFSRYAGISRLCGAIAEVGVARGDFARELNAHFPERRLYLFDTFGGFDERDLTADALVNKNHTSMKLWLESVGYLADTSIKTVLDKLPHPEKVVFKKGYFPKTFDLTEETFCFVNIDTDLYAPTKAGLELFYPLLEQGGVILIHDYFSPMLDGVAVAVNEFLAKNGIFAIPIGDELSIAIQK